MRCRYLDASCLLFGPGQQFLEVVDYQRKQSSSLVGEPGAVRHSGDQLDEAARSGRHTIKIDLAKLIPGVAELFMTLSSYGPARLSVCPCACLSSAAHVHAERMTTLSPPGKP